MAQTRLPPNLLGRIGAQENVSAYTLIVCLSAC